MLGGPRAESRDRAPELPEGVRPLVDGRAAFLILVLLSLAAILPGLFMGIHADDWFHIRARSLGEVLSTFAGDWNAGARGQGGFYRPLIRLSFYLDSLLYGLHAAGYHLTNGLLFAAILVALYRIGLIFAPGHRGGVLFLLGAFLVMNPLKNEALYWISGRTDLLAAAFVFWSCDFALRAVGTDDRRKAAMALGFLLAGLLTKEIAIAACVVLPLGVVFLTPRKRWSVTDKMLLAAPITLGAVYFVYRAVMLGGLAGYEGERHISALFANMGGMLSALFWPWQANSDGSYDYRWAIPGLAAVLLILLLSGFRRGLVWATASMVVALVPMAFVSIAPLDGNRVLLLALGFQLVLLVQVFLGAGSHPRWRGVAAVMGVLAALSLQPANTGEIREYLSARGPNERIMRAVWKEVEALPDGAVIVVPEAHQVERRRILDPGDALLMAMQTHWMTLAGASSADSSRLEDARISMVWSRPGCEVTAAVILQPWMDGPILWSRMDEGGRLDPVWLKRTRNELPEAATLAKADGLCILPLSCGPCAAVAVSSRMEEAPSGRPRVLGKHGSGVSGHGAAAFSVAQGDVTCRWFAAVDSHGHGWNDLRWVASEEDFSLRLRSLHVAEYTVTSNCGERETLP